MNSRRQLRQSLGNSAIIIKQARSWYDLLEFYCLSLFMCFGIEDKEAEDIVGKLSTLKQEERERVKAIKNFENEVVKCEAEIAKPPPPNLGTLEQCKDDVVCIPHPIIFYCTDNFCVIRERSI